MMTDDLLSRARLSVVQYGMHSSFTDKEVIVKIKAGEIEYFSHIVRAHTDVIERLISSKLFNKDDADDLVQNVFFSFYRHVQNFDEKRSVLPYLYQIARNELKMYYRAHQKTFPLDEKIEVPVEDTSAQEEQDVALALAQLSQEQKNALQLVYEGYSYQEIAQQLQRPLNTVRTIIRRARLFITKQFGHEKKS